MLARINRQNQTQSLKKIKPQPIDYGIRSTCIMSPFIRQLKIYEQRTSKSNRNARQKYRQQSKQYKMRSASILKQTQQMMNKRSSVSFCDHQLIKVMEENDNNRQKELDFVQRIRKYRSKQKKYSSTRWLQSANTSVRTQKFKVLQSKCSQVNKQNQIPAPLKTFLNYKKNPLKIKPIF